VTQGIIELTFWVLLGVGVGSLGIIGVIAYEASKPPTLVRSERKELQRLRFLVDDIDQLMSHNWENDPITSDTILKWIDEYKETHY